MRPTILKEAALLHSIPRISFFIAFFVCAFAVVQAQSPATTLVSVNRFGNGSGNQAALNNALSISANGRYVAFVSEATDLAANDNNNATDVFVRDRLMGQTILVSVNAAGTGTADQFSRAPTITPDGRFVVFISAASNLVTDDAANLLHEDVFIRDLQLGTTKLVSRNFAGTGRGNGASGWFDPLGISDDGRYVVFTSSSTDLTAIPDNNNQQDVFVRDLQTNTTELVSVNKDGTGPGNNVSGVGVMTPDGRFVAFISEARDLTATNTLFRQVFVRDLQTNTTKLVTPNFSGTGASSGGTDPGHERNLAISNDGRFIAFVSSSADLVPNDNGLTHDVFVRDSQLETTVLVSVTTAGLPPATGNSGRFAMTPDGRYVTFVSACDTLVNNDSNQQQDVFLRDLQTNTTTLISVNQSGVAGGNGAADTPFVSVFLRTSISNDGRYVSFGSSAANLTTPTDINSASDIFVRDRQTSTTILASKNVSGSSSSDRGAGAALISRDGSTVCYFSGSTDLVGYDTNGGVQDLFAFLNIEQPGQIRFKFAVNEAGENGGSATVTVTKLGPPGSTISVGYSTSDGTAMSGVDYTPASGTLSFGPTDTEKTFTVSALNDSLDETDETVILKLASVVGSVPFGEPSVAVVSIVDDDPPPAVQINNATVEEGDSGSKLLVFTVSLSAESAKVVNVRVATQAGTATPGQDFAGGSVLLTYVPGQTIKQVAVFGIGDITVEGIEHFFVNLIDPVNTTIANGQGVGTIIDDDAVVLLTETSSQRAIALNSPTQRAEPFSISNDFTFTADRLTRISLFAIGIRLNPNQNGAPSLTATAEDSRGQIHPLVVEFAADVPGFDWLTQIVVKLNPSITFPDDVKIKIT
ncbi:MAG TPA: Calx-beta domain-containing protein, partial [Pyrinomonadaceae bacterium]|nr:Calx-beta domain-containing protein [Pyrinomonadaceae bacterium]